MADTRCCYLVCATQRSGSTLLCELLKEIGVAGHPEEYFEAVPETGAPPHPGDFLDGLPRTGAGIRDDDTPPEAPPYSSLQGIENYREHLTRTFARGTTANGVFGAKLMFNQLPQLEALCGQLPELAGLAGADLLEGLFRRPTYIWVSRRDKVRQAVSLWKALQTRSWRHGDGRGDRHDPQYRFEGIDHLVGLFESDERGWRELFASASIEPLAISYEDELERDPQEAVRRTLERIGVPPPPDWHVATPLRRQADSLSEQWIAAYHRDRAQRGSSAGTSPVTSL